tara:strand:+ start:1895 stop:2485 length:591 start_codon:yes stop_codon:yes gene_type:complete
MFVTATCHLSSASVYSQSRPYQVEKKPRETPGDYEKRTWRERMHLSEKNPGFIVIPAMQFKNSLAECAKYMSQQIPGKGKATYTKHFEAGVIIMDSMELDIKADDVKGETVFVPSSGKRGDGNRVYKTFPKIPSWAGVVEFTIFDHTITEAVFKEHLMQAGQFIGIGRWRPRNNGLYGRFTVDKVVWKENEVAKAA